MLCSMHVNGIYCPRRCAFGKPSEVFCPSPMLPVRKTYNFTIPAPPNHLILLVFLSSIPLFFPCFFVHTRNRTPTPYPNTLHPAPLPLLLPSSPPILQPRITQKVLKHPVHHFPPILFGRPRR